MLSLNSPHKPETNHTDYLLEQLSRQMEEQKRQMVKISTYLLPDEELGTKGKIFELEESIKKVDDKFKSIFRIIVYIGLLMFGLEKYHEHVLNFFKGIGK